MPDLSSDALAAALAEANDTRAILAGRGVVSGTGALFLELFAAADGAPPAQIVADERTWAAAGDRVRQSLLDVGIHLPEPLVLPAVPTLYASYDNVVTIREHLQARPGIAIAVGAGTLNDLVKLASSELDRPYVVVATAASMDGYAAYGASITADGFKQTIYCPAPAAVVADLEILAAAPSHMTATGFGDLIEKIPSGADWILADALGVEAMSDQVWELVQGPLGPALEHPGALRRGDADAVSRLSEGLLMSGLAMQSYRSSRPASGAGHQFSHLWEMEGLGREREPALSHGEKVGIGTVALCALYDVILDRDLSRLDVNAAVAAWPSREQTLARVQRAGFAPDVETAALEQSEAKYVSADQLRSRLESLREQWPDLRERLRRQLLPAAEVERRLRSVGSAHHPAELGLDEHRFRATYTRAQMIRSRYTLLDVLLEANLLEECVAELFTPAGFWGSRPWPER